MILIENNHTATMVRPGSPTPATKPGPTYRVRLAREAVDVRRAQRLRFEVFNLELNEGVAESHFTGLDADAFDEIAIISSSSTSRVTKSSELSPPDGPARRREHRLLQRARV